MNEYHQSYMIDVIILKNELINYKVNQRAILALYVKMGHISLISKSFDVETGYLKSPVVNNNIIEQNHILTVDVLCCFLFPYQTYVFSRNL